MTNVSQHDIGQAIDETFGAGTPRTVTVHSSGAVSIVLRAAERVVLIDGTSTEWGVSVDPSDDEAFTGHSVTVASFAEALRTARAGLDG
ncbi:hypothetical protein [Streptomyces sp. SID13031]|uniref:hypothetical protein n=1 Tax=Streptomyces sp. SID13031 TaxID=2706046 RepID=UPI0013C5FE06|nr:hypothetical protein [Streptomyces sp. SID13031]NEA30601.1 hypothetical protein [Streptomyces sp. SID13031]